MASCAAARFATASEAAGDAAVATATKHSSCAHLKNGKPCCVARVCGAGSTAGMGSEGGVWQIGYEGADDDK